MPQFSHDRDPCQAVLPATIPACLAIVLAASLATRAATADAPVRPNVVFVVADDLGWRDMGYSGSPHAKTPQLDDMAAKGVRFDYFYPAQQMCSPGRFAIMTGRTPFRTGLHHLGAMREKEITLAKALKTAGYRTGHFGKWHLGSAATSPAKMGFDEAIWQINYYDLGAKLNVADTKEQVVLEGDTSVATMELALKFIRKQVEGKQPFFVQVCFPSPHSPHKASDEFKAIYKDLPDGKQDFYGEISGVDAAVGNLRSELRKLGVADNTLIWFVSDNGGITKDSLDPSGKGKMNVGVRTAGVLEWPAKVKQPIQTSVPAAHMDMYPTILDITGVTVPNQPVLDGISLVPLLDGKMKERPKALGFMLWNGKAKFESIDFVKDSRGVLIDGRYKLVVPPARQEEPAKPATDKKKGKGEQKAEGVQLYDIFADPAEKTNLAEQKPDEVKRLRDLLEQWQRSVRDSFDGKDFK